MSPLTPRGRAARIVAMLAAGLLLLSATATAQSKAAQSTSKDKSTTTGQTAKTQPAAGHTKHDARPDPCDNIKQPEKGNKPMGKLITRGKRPYRVLGLNQCGCSPDNNEIVQTFNLDDFIANGKDDGVCLSGSKQQVVAFESSNYDFRIKGIAPSNPFPQGPPPLTHYPAAANARKRIVAGPPRPDAVPPHGSDQCYFYKANIEVWQDYAKSDNDAKQAPAKGKRHDSRRGKWCKVDPHIFTMDGDGLIQ